jgi:hypothetical protein
MQQPPIIEPTAFLTDERRFRRASTVGHQSELKRRGYPADTPAPWFSTPVVCAKCGARGRHIDVRPNWKEQPPRGSLTGKVWH